MNRLCETQHRRCDGGEQTALEEERRMGSGMEVSSWVGRDLRGWWCVGERERRGKERRKEREKERISLFLFNSSSTPRGNPRGIPCGAYTLRGYTLRGYTLHTLPLNPHRPNPDPKMGDPHLLPTRGKGGKRGGKPHSRPIHTPIFLSGGEPPDPPTLLGRARKRQEKRGRALT